MDESRPADPPAERSTRPAWAAGRPRRRTSVLAVLVAGAVVAIGLGALVVSQRSDSSPLTSPAADTGAVSGGTGTGTDGTAAGKRPADADCADADRELFDQLGSLVPQARAGSPRPVSESTYCPDGARGVEVDVSDGRHRGVLRVLLSPPGSLGGGSSIQTGGGSISTTTVSVRGGGSLSLTAQSAGRGAAPFRHQLDDIAAELARRNARR